MGADTIFALSSGRPPAAIAIIRISGPAAQETLQRLTGRSPQERTAQLASLRDPESGQVIDNALVLFFRGPRSSTGEDVAELHLHGGRSVIAAAERALRSLEDLRPAEPGEFTRRAFENGRIDLTEAEGLSDLLQAETESQRRAALALAGGALARRIQIWEGRLLRAAAQVEALLDFSDEDDVGPESEAWRSEVVALSAEMETELAKPPAERLRDGIRVVIAGPPNAGKSTLLNALAGRDAAITSDIPGTTRDVLEAPVSIGGIPFLFADTAGLRPTEDAIETIGVERAEAELSRADIILWLGAAEEAPTKTSVILIEPKADVLPASARGGELLRISAVTGQGMKDLADVLAARSRDLLPAEDDVPLNRRHREAIAELNHWLRQAAAVEDLLIVAEHLRLARSSLDRITGRSGVEQMLDALFGTFCIGK